MRTAAYKGRTLGNSVSAFSFYKRNTGRGLQADVAVLTKANAALLKLDSADELTKDDIDMIEKVDVPGILINLYVALRQAGDHEARSKNPLDIQDELSINDMSDPELLNVITELLSSKKA